jgi:hypothetical protein
MKNSPHTPEGKTTRILFALFGALFLLLALSLLAKGVNPYCGQVVGSGKYQGCVGGR